MKYFIGILLTAYIAVGVSGCSTKDSEKSLYKIIQHQEQQEKNR